MSVPVPKSGFFLGYHQPETCRLDDINTYMLCALWIFGYIGSLVNGRVSMSSPIAASFLSLATLHSSTNYSLGDKKNGSWWGMLVGGTFLLLPYLRIMNIHNAISRRAHFAASVGFFGYHAYQYYLVEYVFEDAGEPDEY